MKYTRCLELTPDHLKLILIKCLTIDFFMRIYLVKEKSCMIGIDNPDEWGYVIKNLKENWNYYKTLNEFPSNLTMGRYWIPKAYLVKIIGHEPELMEQFNFEQKPKDNRDSLAKKKTMRKRII